METTKYRSATEQTPNDGFHMNYIWWVGSIGA